MRMIKLAQRWLDKLHSFPRPFFVYKISWVDFQPKRCSYSLVWGDVATNRDVWLGRVNSAESEHLIPASAWTLIQMSSASLKLVNADTIASHNWIINRQLFSFTRHLFLWPKPAKICFEIKRQRNSNYVFKGSKSYFFHSLMFWWPNVHLYNLCGFTYKEHTLLIINN